MDLREAFDTLVRACLSDVTYLRKYAARVERDNGDGTVDVSPEDAALKGSLGLQRVKVLVGVAGASARIEPGTRCLVGFEDGLPSKPYVCEWEFKNRSATISLGGGGGAVARKGDMVDVFLTDGVPMTPGTGTPITAQLIGTFTPTVPPGPPIPILPIPATFLTGHAQVPTKVYGAIAFGARTVKA